MAVAALIRKKLNDLPHKPGIYLMKDRFGTVIYVGKARDLRRRRTNLQRDFINDNQDRTVACLR